MANECNFPEELISNGKYPEWSNSEHLHNLRQLSRMDIDDYPLPSARTSTPLNSGQKGKGIGQTCSPVASEQGYRCQKSRWRRKLWFGG